MKKTPFLLSFLIAISFINLHSSFASQDIISIQVEKAPTIDGMPNDHAWKAAKTYTIQDMRLKIPVHFKSVYTNSHVFFLVNYPDPTKDILHKPWVWSKEYMSYILGTQREDTFIFRWNMNNQNVDLSSFSDDNFTSDMWYWKANRSNPAGYADDKLNTLSSIKEKKSATIISKNGKTRFLLRQSDQGKESYEQIVPLTFQGEIVNQFKAVAPAGSRGDVKAKGIWQKGFWSIEFARKLDTNNDDDIHFDVNSGKKYLFGISVKSLYGEAISESLPNFYGQGRISEPLYLVFK